MFGICQSLPTCQSCHKPSLWPQIPPSSVRAGCSGFLDTELARRLWSTYRSLVFFWKTCKPSHGLFFFFSPQDFRNLKMESSRDSIWLIIASPGSRRPVTKSLDVNPICAPKPVVWPWGRGARGGPPHVSGSWFVCLCRGGWARSLTFFFQSKIH